MSMYRHLQSILTRLSTINPCIGASCSVVAIAFNPRVSKQRRLDRRTWERVSGVAMPLGKLASTRRGFRRMGLARAMLLAGMRQIKAAGMDTVKLGVDALEPIGCGAALRIRRLPQALEVIYKVILKR